MGAQDFGHMLNKYYLEITNIIFEHNGVVRYLGDGVMSVFGMSDENQDHKSKSLESGMAILERMEVLSSEFEHPLNLRLSIKAGRAVVGYVGTSERVEFTVLGDLVNVAKGMNSFANPNRIVVGEEIYKSTSKLYEMVKLESITVKGRKGQVKIFEVIPPGL
jgi:adenylate cyclase